MTKVYDQYDAAFRKTAAAAILKDGNYTAKVCIKYPADGAGRLYAYVHVFRAEMARGFAGGYGYDKTSAAIMDAMEKMKPYKIERTKGENAESKAYYDKAEADGNALIAELKKALEPAASVGWSNALRDAGFTVLHVL